MGFAIAQELAEQNYKVILVAGPVHLQISHPNITRLDVRSAKQMLEACLKFHKTVDAVILSAAVADFTPETVVTQKIKEKEKSLTIKLIPNPDIAKQLGERKQKGQVHIGFALETQNALENAKGKLERKNFDFIVLNSLEDAGAGFGYDTNKISIIDNEGKIQTFELKPKVEVAKDIINKLATYLD